GLAHLLEPDREHVGVGHLAAVVGFDRRRGRAARGDQPDQQARSHVHRLPDVRAARKAGSLTPANTARCRRYSVSNTTVSFGSPRPLGMPVYVTRASAPPSGIAQTSPSVACGRRNAVTVVWPLAP